MLKEYDFSNGLRGKYAKAYTEGVNIVKLDTNIMKFFPKCLVFFELSFVTFFSLFRNERKKSNQKKESAKGCRQ